MYATLKDGAIDDYPLSLPDLRRAWPLVNFPLSPSAEDLLPLGIVEVITGVQPEYDPDTQTVVEQAPVLDAGQWRERWAVQEVPMQEREARLANRRARMKCSRAQGQLALLQAGVLDALEAWVATQSRETQIEYAARGEWRRDWPLVATGAAALGLTDAQMDDLFRLADTL